MPLTELDEIWAELHDTEERVGRLEADLIARKARAEDAQARTENWRWVGGTLVAVVSCVALIISLHLF